MLTIYLSNGYSTIIVCLWCVYHMVTVRSLYGYSVSIIWLQYDHCMVMCVYHMVTVSPLYGYSVSIIWLTSEVYLYWYPSTAVYVHFGVVIHCKKVETGL